jgi:glycerol-3-phosphate acyltransferase PlsX
MRIAFDAMGGDFGPSVTVRGAVLAASDTGAHVVLVGRQDLIEAELRRLRNVPPNISVIHASDVISMYDQPMASVRRRTDSSLVVAARMVADGHAEALVSAGSTGAVTAAAYLYLGRLPNVERPAIAVVLPSHHGFILLIDSGANADCRSEHLAQFSLMGSIYAQRILGVRNPRVGILSIGEEESKGNQLVRGAIPRMKQLPINYVGPVEGRDIFSGRVDVVVTDGFTGNVVLKTAEGVAGLITGALRREFTKTWVRKAAASMLLPALRGVARRMDWAEVGGAPLLGVKGVVIIAHGRSNVKAIKNALVAAAAGIRNGLVQAMAEMPPTKALGKVAS